MRDRAGFFAGCADTLTDMCLYYAVAALLIMAKRGWGLHLFWLLLWAVVCMAVYRRLLRKPRTTPLLTAVTAGLALGGFALFLLASSTPPTFGYGFVLAVGAGMAVGLPLNFTLHRPKVLQHLTQLDVLILALLFFLLTKDALGIDRFTLTLTVAVLFMDAAAAVGLRMSDGDSGAESGSAFRASMVALASAAALALLIGLFSWIFSRSGAVTGGVLQGVGSGFTAIGRGIEHIFQGLARLLYRPETMEAVELEGELPSLAGAEAAGEALELNVNTTVLGIALCVLAAAAAVLLAVRLRRRSVARELGAVSAASEAGVTRTGGTAGVLWQRLRAALRFRWTAFVNRDTPAGLLVRLERRGKRMHEPRRTGESMRAFLGRMDPSGGLGDLADALDLQYYGGGDTSLSRRRCRELGRYIRRDLRRERRAGSIGEERA